MRILMKHITAEVLDMDAFDTELDQLSEYQESVRSDIDAYYKNIES